MNLYIPQKKSQFSQQESELISPGARYNRHEPEPRQPRSFGAILSQSLSSMPGSIVAAWQTATLSKSVAKVYPFQV